MTHIPEGFYFTKQHEWAKEEDGVLMIGISDYAQHSLGDIVFVDMQGEGTSISAGDTIGTIESVKAAEDIYAPVSGTISEANPALADAPESINKDPYGSWIVKLSDYKKEELTSLMDSSSYKEFVSTLDH